MTIRIGRNALFAVAQAGVAAIGLFVLYRILILSATVADLGIWALVTSVSAFIRLSDGGIGASLTRFMASRAALTDERAPLAYFATGVISLAGFYLAATLIGYYPLHILFGRLLEADAVSAAKAQALLPYVLASIVLMALQAALNASLDGLGRADVRAGIQIAATMLMVAAGALLIPQLGLPGIALAQICQSLAGVLLAWVALRRLMPEMRTARLRWRRDCFAEMLGYGMKLQIGAVGLLLFEPVVKLMINHFGSLSDVGYYEVAQRLVIQVRGLIYSGAQTLVAPVASYEASGASKLSALIRRAALLVGRATIVSMLAAMAATPLLGHFLGLDDWRTLTANVVILAAWSVNTLTLPAFFLGVGTGAVNWNVAAQYLISALSALIGGGLGSAFGALGVVAGSMLGLALGSMLIVYGAARGPHWESGSFIASRDIAAGLVLMAALAFASALRLFT